MQDMTLVMERSPDAFKTMNEEALRQHFLVQLNAQFEGKATGQTFNMAGKTDILLREGERNVFIAECKFWKGPKALSNGRTRAASAMFLMPTVMLTASQPSRCSSSTCRSKASSDFKNCPEMAIYRDHFRETT